MKMTVQTEKDLEMLQGITTEIDKIITEGMQNRK